VSGAIQVHGIGKIDGAYGIFNNGGTILSTGTSPITVTAERVGASAVALYSNGLIGGGSASGDVTINANDVAFATAGVQTGG